MAGEAIGFDTETHLIARGRLVPRMVCLSLAGHGTPPQWVAPFDGVVSRGDGHFVRDGASWWAVYDRDAAALVVPHLFDPRSCSVAVAHNAPYDIAVLLRAFPEHAPALFRAVAEGRVVDTKIRERLLRIATGELDFRHHRDGSASRTEYTLAGLAALYLGTDRSAEKSDPNAWRMRYSELDGVPVRDWPEAALAYAGQDAIDALDVALVQGAAGTPTEGGERAARAGLCVTVGGYPVIESGGPLGATVVSETREVCAALALHLEAVWGLRVDPTRAAETLRAWDEHAAAGREAAARRGWVRVAGRDKGKPGSLNKAALQDAIYRAMMRGGVDPASWTTKPSRTFPAGQVKVSEAVVLEAADYASPDPEGDDLRAYAGSIEYTGHLSRWGPTLHGARGYALTSSPEGLRETGRTAWRDPPLQQPPRKGGLRECVEAREGYVLCSVDYDAAEFIACGQVCLWAGCGDTIAVAMNAGRDPHSITGAAIRTSDGTPTTYEQMLQLVKAADPDAVRDRQVGKHSNFGFLGGMGAVGFAAVVRKQSEGKIVLTPERAVAVREVFFGTWAPVSAYLAWVQAVVGDGGVVRHPVSGRVRGGVRMTAAFNGYFQGLVADGAKYAAWLLCCAAYTGTLPDEVYRGVDAGEGSRAGADVASLSDAARAFAGSRPVLFLHDEVIAELPRDRAHEAAEGMALVMRWAMQRHIPDIVVRAEPALMARWYKAAKTVRDDAGRLALWSPPSAGGAP